MASNIAIYTLTSELHDEQSIRAVTEDFLGSLKVAFELKGDNYNDYGSHALDLIYVRTGGTEGIFKPLLPELTARGVRRFHLLTSGKSNSLAASMEILSYLRQQGLEGEIIHGATATVRRRIAELARVAEAREKLRGTCLGVIGKPSDWLIASDADYRKVYERLGIWLEDIPMEELLEAIRTASCEEALPDKPMSEEVKKAFPGAVEIHEALKSIVMEHNLNGLTLRCFDLLTSVGNTGCLALARLNAQGIPAGCEGDVPALLSMTIARAATGVSGFQANPSRIDPETGEMLFAHCTVPLDIVSSYDYDTHFESGIGVGIRGRFEVGPVTVFKVSGDLSRHFVAEGILTGNQAEPDLCRTQVLLRLDPADARYFLTEPIGNHHIIIPGRHKAVLEEILR